MRKAVRNFLWMLSWQLGQLGNKLAEPFPPRPEDSQLRWWEMRFSVEATYAEADELWEQVNEILCGGDEHRCWRGHLAGMRDITEELEAEGG